MANISTIRQPGDGGDYDTIQDWEDATSVSLSDDEIGHLYDRTANAAWAENVVVAGATLNGFHRELVAPAGERHTGNADTGAKVIPTSAGHAFTINEDNFIVRALDVALPNGGSSDECFRVNNTGFKAIRCILRDATTSQGDGIYPGGNNLTINAEFCAFQNIDRTGIHVQNRSNCTINMWGCTVINCDGNDSANFATSFGSTNNGNSGTTFDCRNSYSARPTSGRANTPSWSAGSSGSFDAASTNNGAEDTTSPGANPQNSLTPASQFVSVTLGAEDVHLQSSVALEGAGTDISAVVTEAPALDIDHQEVDWGNPNIGCDQAVSAVPPTQTTQTASHQVASAVHAVALIAIPTLTTQTASHQVGTATHNVQQVAAPLVFEFHSHFPGTSLPVQVLSDTTNAGTVTVANSQMTVDSVAGNGGAAMAWIDSKLDTSLGSHWTTQFSYNTTVASKCLYVVSDAGTRPPIYADSDALAAASVFRISFGSVGGTPSLLVEYYQAQFSRFIWDSVAETWVVGDGSQWSARADFNEPLTVTIEFHPTKGMRVAAVGNDASPLTEGNRGKYCHVLTDYVPLAGLQHTSDLWCVFGNPFDDFGAQSTTVVESTMLSQGAPQYGSYDGTAAGSPYGTYIGVRCATDKRFGQWVPTTRGVRAVPLGPGTYDNTFTKDPSCVTPDAVGQTAVGGTTTYMAYDCGGTNGQGFQIALASFTGPECDAATITKDPANPITPTNDPGEPSSEGKQFPQLRYDPNDTGREWKMFVISTDVTGPDVLFRLHWYSATGGGASPMPADGATWVYEGLLVDIDPGTWRDDGVNNPAVAWIDGEWHFWVGGAVPGAVSTDWSIGLFTTPDLAIAPTEDPNSPQFVPFSHVPEMAPTSGGTDTDTVTLTAVPSPAPSPDADIIWSDNSTAGLYGRSRLKSISGATLTFYENITYTSATRFYQIDAGNCVVTHVEPSVGTDYDDTAQNWTFTVTPWAAFNLSATIGSFSENGYWWEGIYNAIRNGSVSLPAPLWERLYNGGLYKWGRTGDILIDSSENLYPHTGPILRAPGVVPTTQTASHQVATATHTIPVETQQRASHQVATATHASPLLDTLQPASHQVASAVHLVDVGGLTQIASHVVGQGVQVVSLISSGVVQVTQNGSHVVANGAHTVQQINPTPTLQQGSHQVGTATHAVTLPLDQTVQTGSHVVGQGLHAVGIVSAIATSQDASHVVGSGTHNVVQITPTQVSQTASHQVATATHNVLLIVSGNTFQPAQHVVGTGTHSVILREGPMITNYVELKDAIADWLVRPDMATGGTRAHIPETFIQLAEGELRSELKTKHKQCVQVTLLAGATGFAVPQYTVGIKSAYIVTPDTEGGPIDPVSPEVLYDHRKQALKQSPQTSRPEVVTIVDLKALVSPIPDQDYTIELVIEGPFVPLDPINDTNYVLRDYPGVYLYGALMHSAMYLKDDERQPTWEKMYGTLIEKLRRAADDHEWPNVPSQVGIPSIGAGLTTRI